MTSRVLLYSLAVGFIFSAVWTADLLATCAPPDYSGCGMELSQDIRDDSKDSSPSLATDSINAPSKMDTSSTSKAASDSKAE